MRRRTWILTGLAVVLLFLAYAGWSVWQVRSDLTEARSSAERLRVALVDGDQKRAEEALESLQDTSGSAADRTDGPLWAVFGAVPGLGDDARGVRTVASVLDDVSHEGLDPLVASADSLDSGTFTPVNGQVPVDSVAVVAKPLAAARDSFAAADEELAGVDSSGFTGAFGSAYDDLSGQVHRASTATTSATTAAELLPGMLGGEGARDYLLIFQNNAEARSTGGLPGAATILNATDGKITIPRAAQAPGLRRARQAGAAADQGGEQDLLRPARHLLPGRELHPRLPAHRRPDGGPLEAGDRHGPRRGGLGRPGGDGLPARGDRPGHRRRASRSPATTPPTS